MRRTTLAVLAFLLTLSGVAVFAPASSAGCRASSHNWGTNCSVSTATRTYSELARGAQRGIRADGTLMVADGKFGSNTKTKIKNFQTAHGLSSDGIVGTNTWTALYNELGVGNGNQTSQAYTDNNVHTLTRFHHIPKWTVKKWNSSSFFDMDDQWRG